MKPLAPLAVLVLALLPLTWSPAATAAPAPRCDGHVATVVGGAGTPGDDVIVSNGATEVDAGAGDDLICVTRGPALGTSVLPGPGRDVVIGGAEVDDVDLDDDDGDHDVVRTGGGDDSVELGDNEGSPTRPSDDRVDLGPGDDLLQESVDATPDGRVDGGPGRDSVDLSGGDFGGRPAAWVLDARRGVLTRAGRRISTLRSFEIVAPSDLSVSSFRFRGSRAAERFYLGPDDLHSAHRARVDMGGGDDVVVADGPVGFDVTGGPGRDRLLIADDATYIDATVYGDLRTGRIVTRRPGSATQVADATGFEDALASDFLQVTLLGTDAADRLSTTRTCRTRLEGRGGDDVLVAEPERYVYASTSDCHGARLLGGPGDDRLRGGTYDDHLVGGPGRDRADGAGGSDTCAAEERIRCERP